MMEKGSEQLIEAIQSSGFKAALVVSGGGSGAVHALLSHPGASRFVFDVQIPYSSEAMVDYLGERPVQFCSSATARQMAAKALEHVSVFHDTQGLGIACSAALKTQRDRKGNDRAFFCIKSCSAEVIRELEISTGSRVEQESSVSDTLLTMLAYFTAKENPWPKH